MKNLHLFIITASLMLAHPVHAESSNDRPAPGAVSSPVSEAAQTSQPQLSDNPKMKAEGKRLAAVMEKLQKESDPEVRRKLMSEAMCPQ